MSSSRWRVPASYLAEDRRVSPTERTRWRFTFRRLADEAQAALAAQGSRPAEDAVEALVDLACCVKGYDCFRPEDRLVGTEPARAKRLRRG